MYQYIQDESNFLLSWFKPHKYKLLLKEFLLLAILDHKTKFLPNSCIMFIILKDLFAINKAYIINQ